MFIPNWFLMSLFQISPLEKLRVSADLNSTLLVFEEPATLPKASLSYDVTKSDLRAFKSFMKLVGWHISLPLFFGVLTYNEFKILSIS